MREMTIYAGEYTGNLANCIYRTKVTVSDEASMLAAAAKDHVTARYKNDYRSNDNFLESDCIALDCDNDHSDDPEEWVTPFDVMLEFPDVAFITVTSRSNEKQKGDRGPRPRFHVYFPVEKIVDAGQYALMKKRIAAAYPYFDNNALDAARFLFGNPDAEIEVYEGDQTIDEYINDAAFEEWEKEQSEIHEGSRNSTMSRYAAKVIKRLGDTDEAYAQYLKEAEKCTPPLSDHELKTIWSSARKFWQRISSEDGYVAPENFRSGLKYKPNDYTDIGQAEMLASTYAETVRYSRATGFLLYNGSFWNEEQLKAQAKVHELTEEQLKEAEAEMVLAISEMKQAGIFDDVTSMSAKKAEQAYGENQAFLRFMRADAYKKFVLKRRDSKYVTAAMKEWMPLCEVSIEDLNKDEFLLNTPSATYNLRYGLSRAGEHKASDLITKQTLVDPGSEGKDIWLKALDTFFQGDQELIDYVQEICGLAAIGKVYLEALIIAYGSGRNGKSTFWNTVSKVLGNYAGNMSADTLTVGCKRNVKPELAEAMGKRLLIAAELEEGMRLNTSNVKQLCSTDEIYAEKKYQAPFAYTPSHTLILYTNFLPRVGAMDEGTWRRLIVVPFNAVIEGKSDIKNYSDYLFENAGPAILAWIMEGSQRVIEKDYRIVMPKAVEEVTREYREGSDWMSAFLEDCCELGEKYHAVSGDVYDEYRSYCVRTGEFVRSTAEFYSALKGVGVYRKKSNSTRYLVGIRLKEMLES